MFDYLIICIICIPFFSSLCVFFPISQSIKKQIILFSSITVFIFSLIIWIFFDCTFGGFQFIFNIDWFFGINYYLFFGIDGISLFFIVLTAFLIPLCLLGSWDLKYKNIEYFFSLFLVLESIIIVVFTTLNLFVFYIFFESVLVPIFFVIGLWGSRERKVRAAYLFFIYTLIGSLFILFAILFIYFEVGTLDYLILLQNSFSFKKQVILWLAFFCSFATKVPMIPVHIWLPEAHVEAPTAGSVLLAGILLKLGSYGFIRFSLPLFPFGSIYFRPFIIVLSCIAIVYTSLTAFRQVDIKRVIAYASVAHINITIVGLFSFNLVGIEGSIYQILSHGVVSGALFLCVGVLYDRHHTRLIRYFSGLVQTIPLFSFFFFSFSIGNIALPGTSSFVGEFLILVGIFKVNTLITFFAGTGIIFGGIYSLWLLNRIIYGNIKNNYIQFSIDVGKREVFILGSLFFVIIFIGFFPNIFLQPLHISVTNVINYIIFLKNDSY